MEALGGGGRVLLEQDFSTEVQSRTQSLCSPWSVVGRRPTADQGEQRLGTRLYGGAAGNVFHVNLSVWAVFSSYQLS